MKFQTLALIDPILAALQRADHTVPTPIQTQSIPALLAGRDVCGTAQTGTGKTAAFALPILQRVAALPRRARVRALVLAPTRELAVQIGGAFETYGKNLPEVRVGVIFGGMGPRAQRRAVEGAEILVATPGRLLDLCGHDALKLDAVEILVLDEADRMLDLGFIDHVQKIVSLLPSKRQTVLFSATMPKRIETLARDIMRDPLRVSVARAAAVADGIDQRVYFVEPPQKREQLIAILADPEITSAMIFTRTRHAVDRINTFLVKAGIRSAGLHGDKVQVERTRVLTNFANGVTRVLVATDVAARGIDIEGVSHVINYDVPNVPESYVHRIGRTARAGRIGVAISLCSQNEHGFLAGIEKLTGQRLTPVGGVAPAPAPSAPPRPPGWERPRSAKPKPELCEEGYERAGAKGAGPARPAGKGPKREIGDGGEKRPSTKGAGAGSERGPKGGGGTEGGGWPESKEAERPKGAGPGRGPKRRS